MALATITELDEVRTEGAGPERDWDLGSTIEFLIESARAIDPDAEIEVRNERDGAVSDIPAEVVRALAAAQSEALRNSLGHAGPSARRTVEIVAAASGAVDVAVRDDGRGFDPAEISPRRLGISVSIRRRMARLPGGWALVHSAPAPAPPSGWAGAPDDRPGRPHR